MAGGGGASVLSLGFLFALVAVETEPLLLRRNKDVVGGGMLRLIYVAKQDTALSSKVLATGIKY